MSKFKEELELLEVNLEQVLENKESKDKELDEFFKSISTSFEVNELDFTLDLGNTEAYRELEVIWIPNMEVSNDDEEELEEYFNSIILGLEGLKNVEILSRSNSNSQKSIELILFYL